MSACPVKAEADNRKTTKNRFQKCSTTALGLVFFFLHFAFCFALMAPCAEKVQSVSDRSGGQTSHYCAARIQLASL